MNISRPAIVRLTAAGVVALGLVLGMISAQAGMISSSSADATWHRMSNGKIAFVDAFAVGGSHLDVINPDGSGLSGLVGCRTRGCGIAYAVWSRDGRRIAFLRGVYPNVSVYVENANGSGERRLVSCGGPVGCKGLSWSPTGTDLAIAHNRALYVFDLNTGRLRLLSTAAKFHAVPTCWWSCAPADRYPAWSPDGSRIAFVRNVGGCEGGCYTEPYVVNADGTGLKRLSSLLGGRQGLLWSPDGRTIAFVGRNSIYAINPDGSHLRLLVQASPVDAFGTLQILASWSPDGRHVLFGRTPWSTGPGGCWGAATLWIMNANGTRQRRLYRAEHGTLGSGIWSPDGQLITLSVEVDYCAGKVNASRSGLFVMDADGRHLHRLMALNTSGVLMDELTWQPIP